MNTPWRALFAFLWFCRIKNLHFLKTNHFHHYYYCYPQPAVWDNGLEVTVWYLFLAEIHRSLPHLRLNPRMFILIVIVIVIVGVIIMIIIINGWVLNNYQNMNVHVDFQCKIKHHPSQAVILRPNNALLFETSKFLYTWPWKLVEWYFSLFGVVAMINHKSLSSPIVFAQNSTCQMYYYQCTKGKA